jgi:carbamoyl-phosphate synthase small subunit
MLTKKNACLVFEDGEIMKGYGYGATGLSVAELCFNTSMFGYQEVISDPSYADQIILFTFPHIGNVGVNPDDNEAEKTFAKGVITHLKPNTPSNWRKTDSLNNWLVQKNIIGLYGLDTRELTLRLRDKGVINVVICHQENCDFDYKKMIKLAKGWSGLDGLDLAIKVTCGETYKWKQGHWLSPGKYNNSKKNKKIIAIDFGIKRNILRSLSDLGCEVKVVPAKTSFKEIIEYNPSGIFLSNGPGDPKATGKYIIPVLKEIIEKTDLPIFGICLGHQILALALGGKTIKMKTGHHGANHPVQDLKTGKVEITSMNHGFTVDSLTLPKNVNETHISLFDKSNCGIALKNKKVFSVQYHPEASPGPTDSLYLFKEFIDNLL